MLPVTENFATEPHSFPSEMPRTSTPGPGDHFNFARITAANKRDAKAL